MFDEVPSFPRTKVSHTPQVQKPRFGKRKYIHETKNKKDTTDTKTEVKGNFKAKSEYSEIWKKPFSIHYATPGVVCLSVVKEIRDRYILLETANSVKLKLPLNMISIQYTKTISNSEVDLTKLFTKGQMLVVKIVKGVEEGAKTNEITVCSIPKQVNSHIVSSNLDIGSTLTGVFEKLEDKGAIIDLGLNSETKGFVPYNLLPSFIDSANIVVGQPFLFSITDMVSRIIQLTGFIDTNIPQIEVMARLNRDKILPGMVMMCAPDDYTNTGVYTNLGNDVKAYIHKQALPPRFRDELFSFKKPIKGVITVVKPNTPIIMVNANPDIVAVTKVEKRRLFEGYKIGDIFDAKVKEILSIGYNLELPLSEDGRPGLVSGYMKTNSNESNGELKVGESIKVRVINFKIFDRCLVVTNDPEILKQKILTINDVKPGKLIIGVVRGVTDDCVRLKIATNVQGTVPLIHATDRPNKNWQSKFPVGTSVRLRALFIDEEHEKVICTAKPTLIASNLPPVTSIDEKYKDVVVHGYILKEIPGGYLVSFYNRITAFMSSRSAQGLPNKSVGVPVKVRIMNVDVQKQRIVVIPSHLSPEDYIEGAIKEKKKENFVKAHDKIRAHQKHEAIVNGPWIVGGKESPTSVELTLPGGNIGRLHVSEIDLSNFKEYEHPMKHFLAENKGKAITVKVIEMRKLKSSPAVEEENLINKASGEKIRFAECTVKKEKLDLGLKSSKLIQYKKKFNVGSTVKCFVTNIYNPKSLYVEVNPYVKGFIPREGLKSISEDGENDYDEGMMIECKVTQSKPDRAQLVLQLTNVDFVEIVNGMELTGKVLTLSTNPIRVIIIFPGKQLGVLRLFGISTDYEEALSLFKKFEVNDVSTFKTVNFNKKKNSWNLISNFIVKEIEKDPSREEKIYNNIKKVPYQTEILGHVIKIRKGSCLVDISSSLTAEMVIPENVEIHVNDVIKCIALKGNRKDTLIKVEYVETVFDGTTLGYAIPEEPESTFDESKEEIKPDLKFSDEKLIIDDSGTITDDEDMEEREQTLEDEENLSDEENQEDEEEELKEEVPAKRSRTELAEKIKDLSEAEKEKAIFERQEQIAENDMEIDNEEDFVRLLTGSPNSSQLWINFIGFYLAQENVDKAREVAERALKTINYKEQDELYNVWVAYLNMESSIGDEEIIGKVYERAANNVDTLKIGKQYIRILRNADMNDLLEAHFEKFIKKFGHDDLEIWYMYAEHLYAIEKADQARELTKRATLALPKRVHVEVLGKFAQLEYKLCDQEKGKTMFEKIIQTYPNKMDIWNIYLDLTIKYESMKVTRELFERITALPLGARKLKPIYKKWIAYEEANGADTKGLSTKLLEFESC